MSHSEATVERLVNQPVRHRFPPKYMLWILQEIDWRHGVKNGVIGEIRLGKYRGLEYPWPGQLKQEQEAEWQPRANPW